jgi:hypothetical protein
MVARAGCGLAQTGVPGGGAQVSHGAIYQTFIYRRVAFLKGAAGVLRAKRTSTFQHASLKRSGNGQIRMLSISEEYHPSRIALFRATGRRPDWRIEEQLYRDPC